MYDPNRRPSNSAMSGGGAGYGQQVASGQFAGQGHFSSNAQRYQMQQQQQQPGRTGNTNHSFNQQVSVECCLHVFVMLCACNCLVNARPTILNQPEKLLQNCV